jgi:hypothetical protein
VCYLKREEISDTVPPEKLQKCTFHGNLELYATKANAFLIVANKLLAIECKKLQYLS